MRNFAFLRPSLILIFSLFLMGATDSCPEAQRAPDPHDQPAVKAGPASSEQGGGLRLRFWDDPTIIEALNLDEQQIQGLKQVDSNYTDRLRFQRRKMQKGYDEMLKALGADPVNEARLEKATELFGKGARGQSGVMIARVAGFREVLTVEQWYLLSEIRPRALQVERFWSLAIGKPARSYISDEDPQGPSQEDIEPEPGSLETQSH